MNLVIHQEGLGYPEGPAVLADGSIVFVDLLHQNVRRYREGAISIVAEMQGSPNGMRIGPDGALYVANNGGVAPTGMDSVRLLEPQIGGRIQRVDLNGAVEDIVVNLPGDLPHRPNDLVFTPNGQIVFTDPQNWECIDNWAPNARVPGYRGGRLFCATMRGEARHLIDIYGFPNGLAFHPDGSLLVAMSIPMTILKFPWRSNGLGSAHVWHQFTDGCSPDGMLWHDDRLYVAGSVGDKVSILDPRGRLIEAIPTGPASDPTNLAVGGGRLWITLGAAGKLASVSL